MVCLVYNRKKIILICLGLIFVLAGYYFFTVSCLRIEEEKNPVNVTVDLKKDQKKDRSESLKKQEFFVDCRLARERNQSQQVEVLKEIAANPVSSAETRDQAQQELMKITERAAREAELEKLVVAQGAQDAVVLIQGKSATVIIQGKSLSSSDAEKIREIVGRVAFLEPGNIFVIPKP